MNTALDGATAPVAGVKKMRHRFLQIAAKNEKTEIQNKAQKTLSSHKFGFFFEKTVTTRHCQLDYAP